MIKKTITWKDFNGNTQTRDFYFHMMKPELADWSNEVTNGHMLVIEDLIKQIIETDDTIKLIEIFKQLIQLSYGIKSADGLEFQKSPEILNKFIHTGAYEVLYMELATNAGAAAEFIEGILPEDLVAETKKQAMKDRIVEGAAVKAEGNQLGV